jgi:hydroxymethylpyrimidine/phosphomethylpyrimidine kinase
VKIKTILTIAGYDPSSGAGVTADLAVMAAHGCFGLSAITALTVQSTQGVKAVYPVKGGLLEDTLDCLMADIVPEAIKVGMLATEQNVRVVARFLRALRGRGWKGAVVLDPVMKSSSGRSLLSDIGVVALQQELLPLVDWVTPNLDELALLAGSVVGDEAEITAAARQLQTLAGVVATGGHLARADDLVCERNGRLTWLRGQRIDSKSTHGTGCAFATAMVCGLAAGMDGLTAALEAKQFVAEAIRRATPVGRGVGPMELLWPLRLQ